MSVVRNMSRRVPLSWEDVDSVIPPNSTLEAEAEARTAAHARALIERVLDSRDAVSREIETPGDSSSHPSQRIDDRSLPSLVPQTHVDTGVASRPPPGLAPDAYGWEDGHLLLVDVLSFARTLQAFGEDSVITQLRCIKKLPDAVACGFAAMKRIHVALSGEPAVCQELDASRVVAADSSTDISAILRGDSDDSDDESRPVVHEDTRAVLLVYKFRDSEAGPTLLGTCRIVSKSPGFWTPSAAAFCGASEALLASGAAFHCSRGGASYDANALAHAAPSGTELSPFVLQLIVCFPHSLAAAPHELATRDTLLVTSLLSELAAPWKPQVNGPSADARVGVLDALRIMIECSHRDVIWKSKLWRLVRQLADACDSSVEIVGAGQWWLTTPAALAASPLIRLLVPVLDRRLPEGVSAAGDRSSLLIGESARTKESDEDRGEAELEEDRVLREKAASVAAALHVAARSTATSVENVSDEVAAPAPWIARAALESIALLDAWSSAFGNLPQKHPV